MDAVQSLEVQTLPVGGVDAVDVADAGGQEVDAQISDLCALCGVSDLAITHDAVLDAADGADLGFDAHALGVCQSDQLLGLLHILLDGVVYQGAILLTDILHNIDKLLCIDDPGGIIVLEVNKIDYSLAEVAQIVEYNEAKVLSCYVTCMPDSNKVAITLKVNTARIEPILDTFIRSRYVIKNTFVSGEEMNEEMRDRYGQLLKFMEM